MLWLLPGAIQERRARNVSNPQGAFGSWLSVPLFFVAWPGAVLTDHLALTTALFVGVYVATKLEPRTGVADGDLMVGLAAFAPLALGIGGLLEVATFIVPRLRGRHDTAITGSVWLYVGSLPGMLICITPDVVGLCRYR